MKYLLDTNLLLWSMFEPQKLSRKARALVADEANDFLFSVASIWEVAIKFAKHGESFTADPSVLRSGVLALGFEELPLTSVHAIETVLLPMLHRDPFDRVLVAQAKIERLALLTADRQLTQYEAPVHFVG